MRETSPTATRRPDAGVAEERTERMAVDSTTPVPVGSVVTLDPRLWVNARGRSVECAHTPRQGTGCRRRTSKNRLSISPSSLSASEMLPLSLKPLQNERGQQRSPPRRASRRDALNVCRQARETTRRRVSGRSEDREERGRTHRRPGAGAGGAAATKSAASGCGPTLLMHVRRARPVSLGFASTRA